MELIRVISGIDRIVLGGQLRLATGLCASILELSESSERCCDLAQQIISIEELFVLNDLQMQAPK